MGGDAIVGLEMIPQTPPPVDEDEFHLDLKADPLAGTIIRFTDPDCTE